MQTVNWGIIGCGDVTELKSGPAFNKVPHSKLVAVMRRNAALAEDYAARHGVARWYSDAAALINDEEVNAIYVATPPGSHLGYAIAAMEAGKPVYVEKPMTRNYEEAVAMTQAAGENGQKLVVAHYRRAQPYFKKIKQLVNDKVIGEIRFARLSFFDPPLSAAALQTSKMAWRVDPAIAGGGLFHDLAPHQLDLACYFFGEPASVHGIAVNQQQVYKGDDLVTGSVLFKSGVVFTGTWCFSVAREEAKDVFEIFGSEGSLRFGVFGKQEIIISRNGAVEKIPFEAPVHVQQPMIEEVVSYFRGEGSNPCTGLQGSLVMKMIDEFTSG